MPHKLDKLICLSDRLNYLSAKGCVVCDRINNLSPEGDRYSCESLFLGDRLNYLSAKCFAVCDRTITLVR